MNFVACLLNYVYIIFSGVLVSMPTAPVVAAAVPVIQQTNSNMNGVSGKNLYYWHVILLCESLPHERQSTDVRCYAAAC
jgi:hypothetical protein